MTEAAEELCEHILDEISKARSILEAVAYEWLLAELHSEIETQLDGREWRQMPEVGR